MEEWNSPEKPGTRLSLVRLGRPSLALSQRDRRPWRLRGTAGSRGGGSIGRIRSGISILPIRWRENHGLSHAAAGHSMQRVNDKCLAADGGPGDDRPQTKPAGPLDSSKPCRAEYTEQLV